MGNSESSTQFPPQSNNDGNNNNNNKEDEAKKDEGSTSSALKIGAAGAGAALLAFSAYSSNDDNNNNNGNNNNNNKEDDAKKDEGSTSSALKIGAAVAGAALLAFGAYSSISSASSQSDDEYNGRRRATPMQSLELEASGGSFCQNRRNQLSYGGLVHSVSTRTMLKVLSYNVWFREDLELCKRMEAIGDLISQHLPDLICLQEVTSDIYEIFQNSDWWGMYKCSLTKEMAITRPYFCMQMSKLSVRAFRRKPFDNSRMGRELCMAEVDVGTDKKLVVATSHLESPCPRPPKWDQMFSEERVAQAKESIGILSDLPNVIFGGDMNWDDELDGAFPLDSGWVDAWTELRAGDNGWTYDTKSNRMLSGNRTLQKRLDRFVCKLSDFKINSIEMVGKEAIPGVSYCKEKQVRGEVKKLQLPVLPSDHYGLLITIQST